jgi:hypothetical protein
MTADRRGCFWEMLEVRMPATARIVLTEGHGPVRR